MGATTPTYTKSTGVQSPTLVQESGSSSKSGAGSQTQSGSQTTQQTQAGASQEFLDILNMPEGSVMALEQLINSLTGRRSRAEAESQLASAGIKKPVAAYNPDAVAGMQGGVRVLGEWTGTDMRGKNIAGRDAYNQAMAEYERAVQVQMSGVGEITNPAVKQAEKDIQSEIATLRTAREGYEKSDAIADSKAFIDVATRQMMEQLMPGINRLVEASGTSGGAVAGLLKNDAAARAAENAAALGVDAAVKYGQISNEQSKIISDLVSKSPIATEALLQALNVSKGSVQTGTKGGSTVQTTTGSQTSTQSTKSKTDEDAVTAGTKLLMPQTGFSSLLNSLSA